MTGDPTPDTAWSEPGSTKGIPDRWQQRTMAGLTLSAGDNRREGPDYLTYITPDTKTPWSVHERRMAPAGTGPHPEQPRDTLIEVARGVAGSQEAARQAAEDAARAAIADRATPKVRVLGRAWPWPWVDCARRRGDIAWFETTQERYDDALEAVPPIYFRGSDYGRRGFFMGEPAAHDLRGIPIHAAFVHHAERYYVREIPIDKIADAISDLLAALKPRAARST